MYRYRVSGFGEVDPTVPQCPGKKFTKTEQFYRLKKKNYFYFSGAYETFLHKGRSTRHLTADETFEPRALLRATSKAGNVRVDRSKNTPGR